MTSSTTATTTTTTNNNNSMPKDGVQNHELNLSWLNESVLEAALHAENLSLNDVNAFHESLKAAAEWGSMDQDVSERLKEKINEKTDKLIEEMVAHETARVAKRLGLYQILKVHKVWEQVQYMADQHGQGAYISMHDFKGLDNDEIKPALQSFHDYIKKHMTKSSTGMDKLVLPYSSPGQAKDLDERARKVIERSVAEKIALAYKKFHSALVNEDQGGYDKTFLEEAFQYTPEDFADLLGVMLPRDEKTEETLDNDRGFKTDDETDESSDEEN